MATLRWCDMGTPSLRYGVYLAFLNSWLICPARCWSLSFKPTTSDTSPFLLSKSTAGVCMYSPFLQLVVGKLRKSGERTTVGAVTLLFCGAGDVLAQAVKNKVLTAVNGKRYGFMFSPKIAIIAQACVSFNRINVRFYPMAC